jgi:hypothetical protein
MKGKNGHGKSKYFWFFVLVWGLLRVWLTIIISLSFFFGRVCLKVCEWSLYVLPLKFMTKLEKVYSEIKQSKCHLFPYLNCFNFSFVINHSNHRKVMSQNDKNMSNFTIHDQLSKDDSNQHSLICQETLELLCLL